MATSVSSPIVEISKGFIFRVNINEAKNHQYIAVLRLHNRKFGVVTSVDSTSGDAVWTEEQTLSLKRGKYDLEVWDTTEDGTEEAGHKLFTQANIGKVKETYASMNGKTASEIVIN